METWSSRALRLLARIMQQGADFLDRQGRRLNRLAVRSADEADEDDRSASPKEERSPGRPPHHWLEKIERSEGPVQWLDHTGDRPPERTPQASPPPIEPRVPAPPPSPDRERQEPHSVEMGGLRSSRSDERAFRERDSTETDDEPGRAAADADRSGRTSSPRFERRTGGTTREESTRKHAAEEVDTEHAAASGADAPDRPDDPAPPQSMRLRRSPSPERPEPEPPPEHDAPRDESEHQSRQSPSNSSEQSRSYPDRNPPAKPAEAERRQLSLQADDEPPPSSPPEMGRLRPDYLSRRTTRHPSTRLEDAERADPAEQQLSTPPPSPGDIEHRARFNGTRAEPSYPADYDTTPEKDAEISLPAPAAHRWPDLPDLGQIMREEVDEPRRWERDMRGWERRQRLNREQRGQLWSE